MGEERGREKEVGMGRKKRNVRKVGERVGGSASEQVCWEIRRQS